MDVPTIQIKVPPCSGNEAGIVTINASDFDPARHQRVEYVASSTPESKGGGEHEGKKPERQQRKKDGPAQGQDERR
jgi:hypothetical protein